MTANDAGVPSPDGAEMSGPGWPAHPGPPPLAGAETVMALLGERMRWRALRALRALADGSHQTVQDLAKRAGCDADLMSRHLSRMREAGLVRLVHPEGANRRYRHYEVPAAYLRALPDGRREIDYGMVVLRF